MGVQMESGEPQDAETTGLQGSASPQGRASLSAPPRTCVGGAQTRALLPLSSQCLFGLLQSWSLAQ